MISSIRKSIVIKELFPLPLRPQMPILSPALMEILSPRMTRLPSPLRSKKPKRWQTRFLRGGASPQGLFHFSFSFGRFLDAVCVCGESHQACNRFYGSFELCPVFDDSCQRFIKFVTLSNANPTKPMLILVRCKGVSIVI